MARSCRTAFLCDIMLEFTQSSASREAKSPLLMMMSDVAAQPVSGRKCHRLSGSTDPSLTMGFILGPPRRTVRGVLLPPGSRSVLETLPAFAEKNPFARDERDTSVCVTCLVGRRRAAFGELLELQHSSVLRGRHHEERADTDIPSSEGHARCIIPVCLENPDLLWFCSCVKAPFLPRQ